MSIEIKPIFPDGHNDRDWWVLPDSGINEVQFAHQSKQPVIVSRPSPRVNPRFICGIWWWISLQHEELFNNLMTQVEHPNPNQKLVDSILFGLEIGKLQVTHPDLSSTQFSIQLFGGNNTTAPFRNSRDNYLRLLIPAEHRWRIKSTVMRSR